MTTASYSPRTWADALLNALGAPVTPNTEQTIVDWWSAEGGAGPEWGVSGNVTNYNPLNVSLTSGPQGYGYDPGTGQFYPGASPTPGNNPPIASFSDWMTGIQATAARLQEPFASQILKDLQANAAESTTASAVGASGWGTGDFASRGTAGNQQGSGPQGSGVSAQATLASASTQTANKAIPNLSGVAGVLQGIDAFLNPSRPNVQGGSLPIIGSFLNVPGDIETTILTIAGRGLVSTLFLAITVGGVYMLVRRPVSAVKSVVSPFQAGQRIRQEGRRLNISEAAERRRQSEAGTTYL
jgi:hypothetical protein